VAKSPDEPNFLAATDFSKLATRAACRAEIRTLRENARRYTSWLYRIAVERRIREITRHADTLLNGQFEDGGTHGAP